MEEKVRGVFSSCQNTSRQVMRLPEEAAVGLQPHLEDHLLLLHKQGM